MKIMRTRTLTILACGIAFLLSEGAFAATVNFAIPDSGYGVEPFAEVAGTSAATAAEDGSAKGKKSAKRNKGKKSAKRNKGKKSAKRNKPPKGNKPPESPGGTERVNGVIDDNDNYTIADSIAASWINGHKTDESAYADGSDLTRVFYTSEGDSLFLYMEVPIYAKNMVWGTGAAPFISEYELLWLTHHSGTLNMDFKTATGSESSFFDGYKAELNGGVSGAGITAYATSLDWLLDDNGLYDCDTTNCNASDIEMSFEFEFDLNAVDPNALFESIQNDGIVFHLSPEKVSPEKVPIPSAVWLFLSALGCLGWKANAEHLSSLLRNTKNGIFGVRP
jgi:hypothetical protein